MVTVSAKLPKGLRDRLDEIGEELGISNRSVLVRMALESFVERQESDGIPPVESKLDGDERSVRDSKRCAVYREEMQLPGEVRKRMGTGGRTTVGIEHENGSKIAPSADDHIKAAFLKPWQEVVGNLEFASVEGSSLRIVLRTKAGPIQLVLEGTSPEADKTRDFLANCPDGSLIGVLRTDSRSRPVLLRVIEG